MGQKLQRAPLEMTFLRDCVLQSKKNDFLEHFPRIDYFYFREQTRPDQERKSLVIFDQFFGGFIRENILEPLECIVKKNVYRIF